MLQKSRVTCLYRFVYTTILILIIANLSSNVVESFCKFPVDLRGKWIRSYDQEVIVFSTTEVKGLGMRYKNVTVDDFECYIKTSSNTFIIMAKFSNTYDDFTRIFICWQIRKVTNNNYMLFEESDEIDASNHEKLYRGVAMTETEPVSLSRVCSSKKSRADQFSHFYKYGADLKDIGIRCPSHILATFSYDMCNASSLNFCLNEKTGFADYKLCNISFMYSSDGILTCMGHIRVGKEVLINIYMNATDLDKVMCIKIPDSDSNSFTATYFEHDCSAHTFPSVPHTVHFTRKSFCPVPPLADTEWKFSYWLALLIIVMFISMCGAAVSGYYFYNKGEEPDESISDDQLFESQGSSKKSKHSKQSKQSKQSEFSHTSVPLSESGRSISELFNEM